MGRLGSYAKGSESWFVCDICGLVYPYRESRFQLYQIDNLQQKPIITGWRVCRYDFDPDVAIKIIRSDPQALRYPRVDNIDLPPGPPYPVSAPVLSYIPGGSLPQTIYYVQTSYQFSAIEGPGSSENSITVPANNLLTIASPPPFNILNAPTTVMGSGLQSNSTGWNVYVGISSGTEQKQTPTSAPIPFQYNNTGAITTYYTIPTSGITANGITPQPLVDSQGFIWETLMTNTWSPSIPGMYSSWVPLTVGQMTYNGSTITASTIPKNVFSPGITIQIQYAQDPNYNGIFKVSSVLNKNTFTYIPSQAPSMNSISGAQVSQLIVSSSQY